MKSGIFLTMAINRPSNAITRLGPWYEVAVPVFNWEKRGLWVSNSETFTPCTSWRENFAGHIGPIRLQTFKFCPWDANLLRMLIKQKPLKKFMYFFLRKRKKVFAQLSSIVNFQFHNFLNSLRILLYLKLVWIYFVNKIQFRKMTSTSSWIVFVEKKIFRNSKIFISEHLRILKMLSVLRNFWLQKLFTVFFPDN